MAKMIITADKFGFQIGVHAIGDKGNNWVLNAFEKAEKVLLTLIRDLIHFPVIHISPADSIEEAVNLMVY